MAALQKILLDVEMTDGTVYEDIRASLADMIEYSDTRARHKWPSLEDDPIRGGAYLAYAAMKRLNMYDRNKGFDEFTQDCVMVSGDFGGDDEVNPI